MTTGRINQVTNFLPMRLHTYLHVCDSYIIDKKKNSEALKANWEVSLVEIRHSLIKCQVTGQRAKTYSLYASDKHLPIFLGLIGPYWMYK